ncbi:MAG: GH3 auxin-responsive promoter family protein, partial [Chloroflexi bacterium]|nr:GH3 auxin-responsive promoter family protein [Chloroflexota bacterium]
MTSLSTLIKQGRHEEIWMKYLGFLDLSIDEFMEIQERLLLEQIDILGKSMMGRMLMGDVIPTSIKEFRELVPLTTYKDYHEYLDQKRTDVLPREPVTWAHTSGRSGEFRFKWAPYTKKMYDRLGDSVAGSMILASCTKKGEVLLEPNDTVLLATAPTPYVSGEITNSADEHMDLRFLPPLEEGNDMGFRDRIQAGFKLAMVEGLDFFYGLASILVGIGEQFGKGGSGSMKLTSDMLRPDVLWRLLSSFIKAKIKGGPLLPKDVWKLKGIMTGGVDASIYKKQIEYYWGKKPLEGYACTEGGSMAMQAWNYQGMTFFPENDFLEFITHEEHEKNKKDPDYHPKTVLYNELVPGIYELVFTNFHGGIFTRYRVGDLFEVISVRDDELDIDLPQVRFYSRDSDIINIAGFALITEKDIWKALEKSDLDYYEWVARKEIKDNKSYLRLFIELKSVSSVDTDEIEIQINSTLQEVNSDYDDLEKMLGYM